MPLKIYNTYTRKSEEFIPGGVKKDAIKDYPPVSIYSCGPTVYSYAHIGNFRTFIFNDLLRRFLKFKGFAVDHTMNITDVDDKTIKGSNEENISLAEYTKKYTEIFFNDLATLHIEKFEHHPRATENIDAMDEIINRLNDKKLVYEKDGSLYFSIANFEKYGRLSNLESREIISGARYDADEYEKDDVRDFALWKKSKDGEPSWKISLCDDGRPGWHIECSAMVRKIYGKTIDIHTGGVDLIFPHHENEIAQSEAAYDEPFARYWIHSEHLLVDGSKMSKSKGNFYTLKDLTDKGYAPRSIRYLLISAHYRKQLNFTLEGLKSADSTLEKIDNFIARVKDCKGNDTAANAEIAAENNKLLSELETIMDDDLNISGAIGRFFEYVHAINLLISAKPVSAEAAAEIMKTLEKADTLFGFIFWEDLQEDPAEAARIEALIAERAQAKKDKNFKRSDEIRDQLLAEGIVLEDGKDGTRWKRKK